MKSREAWRAEKREDLIFRKNSVIAAVCLLLVLVTMLWVYDPLTDACKKIIGDAWYTRIAERDFGALFDIQVNLLFTSISTLAIIVSFWEQRYLGASYKYWLFKKTPYLFTPQEIILLLACTQLGSLPHVMTGGYRLIALLYFLLSWCLFLYLCYQIYVYAVKVSRMFLKVKYQLARSCEKGEWNERCNDIYKKVTANPQASQKNSYWREESEVILQIMVLYRENRAQDPNSRKIGALKEVVRQIIENEVCVRSGAVNSTSYAGNNSGTAQEVIRSKLVKEIIDMGNKVVGNEARCYTYSDAIPASGNLSRAFMTWYDQ